MTIKELEEILIENGAAIRAVPRVSRIVTDVRHKDQYPDGKIVFLPEFKREMLVSEYVHPLAGKFIIQDRCGTSSGVKFHKENAYDSIEEAVSSLKKN